MHGRDGESNGAVARPASHNGAASLWLEAHASQIPPQLSARMLAALRSSDSRSGELGARSAALAGQEILRAVMHRGEGSRADALDLLAADALVTLACELAAGDPESLESISSEVIGAVLTALAAADSSDSVQ